MKRYAMSMERKIQYCNDASSDQFGLRIQYNSNQNLRKLLCRYGQTDSKAYMESQKTQNSEQNIEREVQKQQTNTT